ncbi:hypothetical protein [Clostridium pasteurianum]|uniref:Uncharacterized protein n=1 Tax=Clostridium pasteurianum BC1 TaxID=86416 RepID=R4K5Y4_CLOPA|nr:hypothetical protein [Clostridium pasteurianum]AGK97111.1 hypothetical protein Clopa_2236 [Clostridium pasteurianum BC1]
MKKINGKELISLIKLTSSKKIGILDNNTINFLAKADKITYTNENLSKYDLILIPNWVYEEVKDSEERVDYLQGLRNKNVDILVINELDYEEISMWKQQYVYKFFLYSCFKIGSLTSFLKKNVERNLPLIELEDYEVWLNLLYNNGFEGKELRNGRIQKKNAGEISICVLAFIISYIYYKQQHSITILSNDRDTYDFINFAKTKLGSDNLIKDAASIPITFKSNDFLIKEIYLNNYLKQSIRLEELLKLRDEKRIKYTKNALDGSIEEHEEVLSNLEFTKILQDKSFNIIF